MHGNYGFATQKIPPFKDKTWRLYSLYGTEPEAMRAWKAIEGHPLELKIVPLWPADTQWYAEWCAKNRIEQLEADRENLLQLLESASEVIGRFVSDEGWAQSDMDTMDTIDAEIASMRRG
jgi:hypothetical protein